MKKRLFSLLKSTKKLVSVFDCKGDYICEGYGLEQYLGSTLYNSEILFIKEDTKEISVVVNLELKKL